VGRKMNWPFSPASQLTAEGRGSVDLLRDASYRCFRYLDKHSLSKFPLHSLFMYPKSVPLKVKSSEGQSSCRASIMKGHTSAIGVVVITSQRCVGFKLAVNGQTLVFATQRQGAGGKVTLKVSVGTVAIKSRMAYHQVQHQEWRGRQRDRNRHCRRSVGRQRVR
jgi:hypothetical protein